MFYNDDFINMPRTIFHIGYHKTGTTWFQKKFYPFVRNYKYLKPVELQFFLGNPLAPLVLHNKNIMHRSFIYCNEELSGNIHNGGLNGHLSKNVADRIYYFNKDSEIIIFIRRQDSMINSIYKQYIKKGGNYSIKNYLFHKEFDYQHRTPLFNFEHINYKNLIDYYVSIFGKNNVRIYLYEELESNIIFFLNKFRTELDLDINLDNLDLSIANKGYSKPLLKIVKAFNYLRSTDVLYKKYFLNAKNINKCINFLEKQNSLTSASKIYMLDDDLKNYIHNYFINSNLLLERKYHLPIKKYWY